MLCTCRTCPLQSFGHGVTHLGRAARRDLAGRPMLGPACPKCCTGHILHLYDTAISSKKLKPLTLQAGGEGLNLQVADHVFLIDPYHPPSFTLS